MINRFVLIIVFFLVLGVSLSAQSDSTSKREAQQFIDYASKNSENIMQAIVVDGDTIPIMILDEVLLYDEPSFNSREARRRYYILKRKVIKVYPYAVIAGNKLDSLNLLLAEVNSKRKKKKLIKGFQKYLEDNFEKEIVELTHSEGQILSKLIYRETGLTTYTLIQEYRSGWNAFWWNQIAKLNKMDLRTPYAPTEDEEDKLIETILKTAIAQGRLKERVPITEL